MDWSVVGLPSNIYGLATEYWITIFVIIVVAALLLVVIRRKRRRVPSPFEITRNTISIETPPKVRKRIAEFSDRFLRRKQVYDEAMLKYKDPDIIKDFLRDKIREMHYFLAHHEVDHYDVLYGKGPMFKQVDSKTYVLTSKAVKSHLPARIIGITFTLLSLIILFTMLYIPVIFFGLPTYAALVDWLLWKFSFYGIAGILIFAVLLKVGLWIAKPLVLWIKGTGVAYKVEGSNVYTDQYFQMAARCGFQGAGKGNIMRNDFYSIMKEIAQFTGKASEVSSEAPSEVTYEQPTSVSEVKLQDFCGSCGAEIPSDVTFCVKCGKKISAS